MPEKQRFCPECRAEFQKSEVYPGVVITTAMYFQPYYDEEGRLHEHDGNARTQQCKCSRGHSWTEAIPPPACPTCGDDWWLDNAV